MRRLYYKGAHLGAHLVASKIPAGALPEGLVINN
jgi:hypothetical protein